MNIVLMHGVLGFGAVTPPLPQYFSGVADHLRSKTGASVLVTGVPPIGQIKARAAAAARQIKSGIDRGDLASPFHIIAHSMGGLDARCIASLDLEQLRAGIKSIVCLGTPHFGSPVASLLDAANPFEPFLSAVAPHAPIIERFRQHTDAAHDLSEVAAATFNHECPDVADVRYLNVAGTGRQSGAHTSAFFQPTFLFLVAQGCGQNDGVVPFASATRGQAPFQTWPGDHADLIGHDLDRPFDAPSAEHLARYERLAAQL